MLSSACLFNVLHLLAQSLDLRLEIDDLVGHRGVRCLRTHRVRLATELLEQEIEAPTHGVPRLGAGQNTAELVDVASQPYQFLRDVQAVCGNHEFLVKACFVPEPGFLGQLFHAALESTCGMSSNGSG